MFVGSGGSTSGDSCKTFMNDNQHASNSSTTHTVHWMASVGTPWTSAEPNTNQTISVPQHRSGLPETFQTREKLLPQRCQIQPGSATHTIRKDDGNQSAYITVEQANAQKFIISANCVWGTGTNLGNQHANNLLKGNIQQDVFKGNGLSVPLFVSTQKQMQPLQKKGNQHKRFRNVLPKAIAIVTPLTQHVVESTAPKTPSTDNGLNLLVTGPKESAFGSSHISIQMNISQKVRSQSTSLMCRNLVSENSNEPTKSSRKRLCSEPVENVIEEKKKRTLSCSADELLSSTVRSPKPAEALDMQRGNESPSQQPTIIVKEWPIQSLRHLICHLEECQIKQLKEPSFFDLRTEILRLFWGGEYKQLYMANKNNLYLNIMSEVKHYCQQNNSVILTEIPQESKPKMGNNFLILEHDWAPTTLEHQTSWLNLNKNLDIDEESGYSPLLMASSETLKVVNEGQIKEHAEVDGKTQRTPEHEINSSVLVEDVIPPACVGIVNEVIQENVSDHTPSEKHPEAVSENTEENFANKKLAQVFHGDKSLPNQQNILFKYLMAEKLEKGSNPVQETSFSSAKPHSPSSDPAEKTITEEFCETPQKISDYETKKASDLVIESDAEQSLNAKSTNKSEHQKQTDIIIHYGKTCCVPRWFQTLGYSHGGHCVCERTLWSRQVKGTKNMSARHVQSHTNSLDEVKIGEIITDYKEIQKLAAAESRLEDVTIKHRLKKKKRRRKMRNFYTHDDHTASSLLETNGQNANPESRTKERIINLALFGSSSPQPATTSKWTPKRLDHLPPPPQTLHIRVSSDFDHNPNSFTNLSTKDRILNSWRKSYVPTNVPGKRRSSKLRGARSTKGVSRTDRNLARIRLIKARLKKDSQKPSTLPGKHNHLDQSRRQQVEEAGQVKTSDPAVCNYSNKQDDVQQSEVRNSLAVQLHNTSSQKENEDLLLNFNVLPESFSLTQGSSGKTESCSKNNQGSNIKSPVKPSLRLHDVTSVGAWHFNRKRKRPVDPTVSASESKPSSTFQQFKRRYEDKQRKLPP